MLLPRRIGIGDMMDDNTLFSSKFNYQKIATQGSRTDTAASGVTMTITIPHTAGRISSVRAWYDPGNGRRFPISSQQYSDGSTSVSEANDITARTVYLTPTNLVITYSNFGASRKNVTTYYRIYYDN